MSVVAALNAYVGAAIALPVSALLLSGLCAVNARLRLPFGQRQLLAVSYALVAAALAAPLVVVNLPASGALLPPAVQVWSGTTMHTAAAAPSWAVATGASITPDAASLPRFALVAAGVLAAGVIWMLLRLLVDLRRVHRLIAAAHELRRRGRARVLVSEAMDVPLSFWMPGRSLILVPATWLLRPADLRMALRHEAQHHRQLDTRLLYGLQCLRALFWWHPGAHWLVRQVLELQEFACDEAVAGTSAARREAYCRCLLRTGAHALRAAPLAAAAILGHSRAALVRRVEAALHPPLRRRAPRVVLAIASLGMVAISALAFETATPIHDRRIDLAEAERMAQVARRGSSFPIVVNQAVLAELNALLGTPDGREFLRDSFVRMADHQAHIAAELARYGLPGELLAVPLVESGYRNRVAGVGGGLWMFIAPTARRFGLHVDDARDERLDVVLETDAAMRMLGGLKQQFGAWPLALLAYNRGNAHVEKLMRETGSADAFTLIAGRAADSVYLPRVMAAVLVLANPQALD